MDNDMLKTVRRLVLLNTLYSFGNSFMSSMNEVGDGLDELFDTVSAKGYQFRGVFTEAQNNKDREI